MLLVRDAATSLLIQMLIDEICSLLSRYYSFSGSYGLKLQTVDGFDIL